MILVKTISNSRRTCRAALRNEWPQENQHLRFMIVFFFQAKALGLFHHYELIIGKSPVG